MQENRPPELRRAVCYVERENLSQSTRMTGSVSSAAVTLGLW